MKLFKDIISLKKELNARKKIILVPTMGNLHKGHLSLIDEARKLNGEIVVSIFINPAQFGVNEDFNSYPRTLEEDLKKLEELKVDFVFTPSVDTMYSNNYTTYLDDYTNPKVLCSKFREGHFKGVLTVVNKLFNIVEPDFAIFGEKDYQQYYLIKKMCDDLNLKVKLILAPTVREDTGLALSSRNNNLINKTKANLIYKSLEKAREEFYSGKTCINYLKNIVLEELSADFKIQYIEIFDDNLNNISIANKGLRVFIAAYIDGVRLIDNIKL